MARRISSGVARALAGAMGIAAAFSASDVSAVELDWSGNFRAEANFIHNYAMDSAAGLTRDATKDNAGGYYIPGGGSSTANFQTLFLRLKPRLVVNDNIYIKSEWWLGDPVFGFFGNGQPYSFDQRQFYSTQSRGSLISVQRFWAEFLTDIGTLQVGRAPLNWGLGVVWNAGDNVWDRYESTGDVVRLVSKFGAFAVTPSVVMYSNGNNITGSCFMGPDGKTCSVPGGGGGGGVSDYSLSFKYENLDDDFEGGVNFIKRIAGPAQDPSSGYWGLSGTDQLNKGVSGSNFNTWDLYARKKLGRLTLGGEAPITTGDVGGAEYKTFAIAAESKLKITDAWEASLRAGHAPGQPNITGTRPDKAKVFYLNPNYRIGMIMFNYQLANFAGPNTQNNPGTSPGALQSPFDNPIVNANYLTFGGSFQADKWNFHGNVVYARALETATAGSAFFNYWKRQYFANNAGTNQDNSLGWEIDAGTTFAWDESFICNLDLGWFLPGAFYKFSNVAGSDNPNSSVLAAAIRVGLTF